MHTPITDKAVAARAEQALENNAHEQPHPAFYDTLTGLPNRALFIDRLRHALKRAERPGSPGFSVMMLDLDDFAALNERLGQSAGDELLREIGSRLSDCLRPGDTVGRFEQDTFAILLENVTATSSLAQVAHRLFDTLETVDKSVTASIGMLATDSYNALTAENLLRDADTALRRAKEQGKARYTVFDSSVD